MGMLLLLATVGTAPAQNFDAVSWVPIGCDNPDLISEASPAATNFVGNPAFPAAYYGFDANYLYFRYRMDASPSGSGGFAQYSWTALMQVPSGNPFQYQYQLSLNGQTDTIEIWANTVAGDIDYSPLFHDDSEVRLFSQPYGTLARHLVAGDGSSFGNDPDYFVEFAFPVATNSVWMSGSTWDQNWAHAGHSKSAHSVMVTGAESLPMTCPSKTGPPEATGGASTAVLSPPPPRAT